MTHAFRDATLKTQVDTEPLVDMIDSAKDVIQVHADDDDCTLNDGAADMTFGSEGESRVGIVVECECSCGWTLSLESSTPITSSLVTDE